jgi:hypothetical protein
VEGIIFRIIFDNHSNPWEALFSNNSAYGFDRFQILNEQVLGVDPTLNIHFMADVDYGKFSQQSKYPYINWEPKDQIIIDEVSIIL